MDHESPTLEVVVEHCLALNYWAVVDDGFLGASPGSDEGIPQEELHGATGIPAARVPGASSWACHHFLVENHPDCVSFGAPW